MHRERFLTILLIVLVTTASRLPMHSSNVTPIVAIALFSGAKFEHKWQAFAIPLAALLLSDAALGFYAQMYVVYCAFAAVVCIGFLLREKLNVTNIFLAAFSGASLFFLITHCPLWIEKNMYPETLGGFIAGYTAALPLFCHTLWGDMFYSVLLFGGFALAERRFAWLKAGRIAST